MNERKAVIQEIIKLINGLEEKDKGNLTSMYAIGVLQEAIVDIEATALMCPVRYTAKSNFLGSADNDNIHPGLGGLLKNYRTSSRIEKEIFRVLSGGKDRERYENDAEYREFANEVIDRFVDVQFKYYKIFKA